MPRRRSSSAAITTTWARAASSPARSPCSRSDIHNGADDNASGTSMVLEMARRLGARRDPPPRRVVFMAFSGEERGLLGSQYYVQNPLFPLASTVMMFNCDMVGRLNDKNELTMIGTGTSPGLDALVDVLGKSAGLTIKKVSGMTDGFGGSDHQAFYPRDSRLVRLHGNPWRLPPAQRRLGPDQLRRHGPDRRLPGAAPARRHPPSRSPALAKVSAPPHGGRRSDTARMGSVYVGTIPDYAYEAKDGMRIDGVSEGSPAQKGGLKGGDIITRFGDKPVGTIYDYMASMGKHKPGRSGESRGQARRQGSQAPDHARQPAPGRLSRSCDRRGLSPGVLPGDRARSSRWDATAWNPIGWSSRRAGRGPIATASKPSSPSGSRRHPAEREWPGWTG